MTDYENILKATQSPKEAPKEADRGASSASPIPSLSLEQKAKNYRIFDELMKKGVDLSEIVERANRPDTKPGIDRELFGIMEASVKDAPEVREARKKVVDMKTEIITQFCLQNPGYRELLQAYRNTVNEAYIKLKEGRKDGS